MSSARGSTPRTARQSAGPGSSAAARRRKRSRGGCRHRGPMPALCRGRAARGKARRGAAGPGRRARGRWPARSGGSRARAGSHRKQASGLGTGDVGGRRRRRRQRRGKGEGKAGDGLPAGCRPSLIYGKQRCQRQTRRRQPTHARTAGPNPCGHQQSRAATATVEPSMGGARPERTDGGQHGRVSQGQSQSQKAARRTSQGRTRARAQTGRLGEEWRGAGGQRQTDGRRDEAWETRRLLASWAARRDRQGSRMDERPGHGPGPGAGAAPWCAVGRRRASAGVGVEPGVPQPAVAGAPSTRRWAARSNGMLPCLDATARRRAVGAGCREAQAKTRGCPWCPWCPWCLLWCRGARCGGRGGARSWIRSPAPVLVLVRWPPPPDPPLQLTQAEAKSGSRGASRVTVWSAAGAVMLLVASSILLAPRGARRLHRRTAETMRGALLASRRRLVLPAFRPVGPAEALGAGGRPEAAGDAPGTTRAVEGSGGQLLGWCWGAGVLGSVRAKCWITGCWVPSAEYWMPDAKCRIPKCRAKDDAKSIILPR